MNKVVKAENEKIAAVDFATAHRDAGRRPAPRRDQEGGGHQAGQDPRRRRARPQAIQLVNEAAEKYFIGNAQILRKLETVEKAFWQNAKIVVPAGGELVNVIGDMAGITPVPVKTTPPAQQPQRK